MNKSVIFAGAITNEDLPQYYATADIFINPSYSEGFSLVFVEAIGSGTFTIGTDLPAISDIIEEGKTGFIVKQKDSKQIADKVKYILSNKLELLDMRVKSREIVIKKFDWNIISEIYKQILAGI